MLYQFKVTNCDLRFYYKADLLNLIRESPKSDSLPSMIFNQKPETSKQQAETTIFPKPGSLNSEYRNKKTCKILKIGAARDGR